VGIRAYELRPDLLRAESALLDLCGRGGTLLVQYQRDFAWDKEAARTVSREDGRQSARVTDPNSPVRFLSGQPVADLAEQNFAPPFQDGTGAALIFLGHLRRATKPLLGLKISTSGGHRSAGSARVGKGLYILHRFVVFFRELPAGVTGATAYSSIC